MARILLLVALLPGLLTMVSADCDVEDSLFTICTPYLRGQQSTVDYRCCDSVRDDGNDDGMLSNAGDAAEKNQTRTLTLDQEQEAGDRKEEEEAEVEADSDAGSTIDRLRDEIQRLQDKKRELDTSRARGLSLADKIYHLEDKLVRAQQDAAEADRLKLAIKDLEDHKAEFAAARAELAVQTHVLLRELLAAIEKNEKEIRGLQEMAKEMGTKVRDLAKNLSLTRINALEEAKTRLERELAQLRSEVGERDAALEAMKNAAMVPRVVAAVTSSGSQ